jgi:hypothetical protein
MGYQPLVVAGRQGVKKMVLLRGMQ